MQTALLILCILLCIFSVIQGFLLYKLFRRGSGAKQIRELGKEMLSLRSAVQGSSQASVQAFEQLSKGLREEQRTAFSAQEERMRTFSRETEERMTAVRITVQQNLQMLREEQQKQLDEMRLVVDEKMQKVLSERMQQAFTSVNERLEQVHRGLGEMQTLAGSVGDLKKMLTNIKVRGEIGEIRLEALLTDMLPEGQLVTNAKLGRGTVEFAVRMPDAAGEGALLPIDAKFAGDTYLHLQEAYEAGEPKAIREAQKALCTRIRKEAQDIAEKYIVPPETTDFAVLFLPTEGLYTEAVRAGLTEEAFRKHRVFLTGPTTLAAMLSTLQMGFQSIAVQKYSGEVWKVLGEVKTEFSTYADALAKTQQKLDAASEELEKLVGTRTRAMEKRLNSVQDYLNLTGSDPSGE